MNRRNSKRISDLVGIKQMQHGQSDLPSRTEFAKAKKHSLKMIYEESVDTEKSSIDPSIKGLM